MNHEALASKAADAVGVTPHSDMRLFVEQAAKWALNEAALSATEPVAHITPKALQALKAFGFVLEATTAKAEGLNTIPLYAAPPAPSVAVKAAKTKCKNCGGSLNSWFASNRVNSGVVDGRLKSNEISCDFVLGCDECSETLRVVPADEIANQMNAALSAQVQDVAGWQDISTAPKDGTLVLVANSENDAVFSAWWESNGMATDTNNPGWVDGVSNRYEEYTTYNPSFWMPLPAAPAKQEG